jgi:hypothetical protein
VRCFKELRFYRMADKWFFCVVDEANIEFAEWRQPIRVLDGDTAAIAIHWLPPNGKR